MTRLHSKYLLAGGLAACLLFGSLFWPISGTALQLPQAVCFFRNPTFTLHWIHSVEREVWEEDYLREGAGFVLTRTRFKTFGAGVPYDGNLQFDGKGYLTRRVDLQFPDMYRSSSRLAQTTLFIGDRIWPVSEWVNDYASLHLKPETRPVWRYLISKDYCHERSGKKTSL